MPSRPAVTATPGEAGEARVGDELVGRAEVVMDRGFTVPGRPEQVWPWLVQLGKHRAGWYLPRRVERFLPVRRRAIRAIDPRWQRLQVGDVIPDWGRRASLTVVGVQPPTALVFRTRRGRMNASWAVTLRPDHGAGIDRTRVLLRLRLGPVRAPWLAGTAGELFDRLTVAGLAAGLRERLLDEPVAR